MQSTDRPLPSADALFEHAACGLLVTDTDGRILRVNATFCDWLGYSAAKLAEGAQLQDLLSDGGKVLYRTHWAPLLQTQGSVDELKLDMMHRDGHAVPMLLNAVRRRHGETDYHEVAVVVVEDRHKYEQELLLARRNAEASVAAHQRAQKELQESRDVLSLAMRGARMGAWSHEPKSGKFWWSRELEALAGYAEGRLANTRRGFFELIHPGDLLALNEAVDHAVQAGDDYVAEFRFLHASGDWCWMEGRGRATYDAQGEPLMIYGLGIDITERKEAQTGLLRQAAIFEHLSDAIVITDLRGNITDFNGGSERMLGYRMREILGKPVSLFLPPEHAQRIRREALAALAADGTWRGELPFVRRDGSHGVCETVVKPLANARGDIYGAVSINRDITERRRTEQQLKRLNLELSKADRRKDEFLATLAHELRNPLAPMRNVLEILRLKEFADPQLNWSRDVFDRQLQHMTHLVDDLLEVSRITQGKLELRKQRLELARAMQSAMEAARPTVQASSHHLSVTLPREPLYLIADPTRLSQMILNLLNNAAKYTPPGGSISLAAQREGDEAVIIVRDSGIGIPREHLDSVFEMFSQLAPALDRSQGGLGIGLALVRGLAELHGGTVAAYSGGAGKGSEFVIRLPLSKDAALPSDSAPPEMRQAAGLRVVIVDDNADAADSLAMVLELEGHEVRTTGDGLAGLDLVDAFAPHAVILDIGLPSLNGYEVARRIRLGHPDAGILLIAVTGWGQQQDKQTAEAAGFDHHFTKPVDPRALQRVLTRQRV
ncbi:hybrid sensor histidine kinase/response regulator [Paraburkholderia ginsengiterrae]|uniref:histidine kinase n=1 Tax=Paraburkholderia ginsengiterrae TaxID=1462993 RepID=A0A1A9NFB6_9BURK|nr:PAS domain S-box protein [Paraburkholderia ginsengiterrae]OAJ63739.1 hybrid sensor histidine kinase/response regulator [Paraburkholderia ginsengiterrae]OAJ65100.1 hybrid sensor histidine kinase/response regulator [Paraburkholderia ginsengiterrae]